MAEGFWVFGYGSLMWNPGFECLERRVARLPDYRRAFALSSIRYRGTPERPGLVLGLDWAPGASCLGIAFRICPTREGAVRDYLHRREMVTRSYVEVVQPVALMDAAGTDWPETAPAPALAPLLTPALTYVLDRTHPQYAGGLDLEAQARVIAAAHGPAGPNAEYLHNTVAHLREIGIDDPDLAALDDMVRRLRGERD